MFIEETDILNQKKRLPGKEEKRQSQKNYGGIFFNLVLL